MTYVLFLGPVEKTVDSAGEIVRHIKFARQTGVARAGSFRLSADGPRIGLVEAGRDVLRAIRNDPECLFLCDDLTLDDPITAARLGHWSQAFEARGIPAHWLKTGDTHGAVLANLAGVCFASQRMEGRFGSALPQRLRGAALDTKWAALDPALQEEIREAASAFKVGRGDLGGQMTLREALEFTSREAQKQPVILSNLRLVPDHSYGGRETATATDDFGSGIGASWSNPDGPWNTGTVQTLAGIVKAPGSFGVASMVWTADTFADDQWATIQGAAHKNTVGVVLRSNTTDRAGYLCMEQDGGSSPFWELRVYSSGGSVLDSATDATGAHAILTGDTVTGEIEGTTLRVGSSDSGGSDTERLNMTDATHSSGLPGLAVYGSNDPNQTTITAWSAGDMTAAGGGAIAGSGAVAVSGAGTLKGAGALSGTAALSAAGAGSLKGAGALSGTAAPAFAGAGALRGTGSLAAAGALNLSATGALAGLGALAGAADLVFAGAGTLVLPSGGIAGAAALSLTGAGTLKGAGALAGTGAVSIGDAGTLKGAGALAGAAALSFSGTAAPLLPGAIDGTAALAFSASGAIAAAGALRGLGALSLTGVAALAGAGRLGGLSAIAFTGAGRLINTAILPPNQRSVAVAARGGTVAVAARGGAIAVADRGRTVPVTD